MTAFLVANMAPLIKDPAYVPALRELCDEHDVGAIVPLTDLDIGVLARARAVGVDATPAAHLGRFQPHRRGGDPAVGHGRRCPHRPQQL